MKYAKILEAKKRHEALDEAISGCQKIDHAFSSAVYLLSASAQNEIGFVNTIQKIITDEKYKLINLRRTLRV